MFYGWIIGALFGLVFFKVLPKVLSYFFGVDNSSFEESMKMMRGNTERKGRPCSLTSCVRCNRSKVSREGAMEKFLLNFFNKTGLERVANSLGDSSAAEDGHVLKLNKMPPLVVWSPTDLRGPIKEDVEILEQNVDQMLEEYSEVSHSSDGWYFSCAAKNRKWSMFNLLNQGSYVAKNCKMCPRTVEVLGKLSSLMEGCMFGNAFFSVLEPGADIEPHVGPTNARLRCHLTLEQPSAAGVSCFLQVKDERASWTFGKCMLFDDSQRHSASYHDTTKSETALSKPRVVLVLDLWHPFLSLCEINCLKAIFSADS